MLKAILVLTLCASSVCAQSTASENFTAKMVNGRGWVLMSDVQKFTYLTGIKDILFAIQPENAKMFSVDGFRTDETAKSIDLFYAVPENLRIPIVFALSVSSAKFKGASQAQLDTITADLRKTAAQ